MAALRSRLFSLSNLPVRPIMLALLATVLLLPSAFGATCPFNIPVVTLPPHAQGGFSWGTVVRPLGDACVASIAIEPANEQVWYVAGQNGLYQTKDGGLTWKHPLNGIAGPLLLTVNSGTPLVYVGIANKVYLSRDHGQNWTAILTFNQTVRSLLVNGGSLYVGLAWNTHAVPSGIWISNLGGGLPQFHPFGPGQTGLIVWTLSHDPLSGVLYAGTEIYDHLPQPYHPPFFRSPNGVNWTNVAGTLPWHVISSAVRPTDGLVYALTEGLGVFRSANQGTTWHPPAQSLGLGTTLLMDPNNPTRVFLGRVKNGTLTGGFFVSIDSGSTPTAAGLNGVTVAGLALNGAGTRIYAATYASGIYRSPVPP